MNSRTPKALGLLLTYPEESLIKILPSIQQVLASESWISKKAQDAIWDLISFMHQTDLLDLQAEYVALFDRTPSLDLYLFEHIHGDSRKRGQALVDLNEVYTDAGLFNSTEHTPDYLPLFLEYLSVLPLEKAREDLNGAINVITIIGERLKKRETPYAAVFGALKDMASRPADDEVIARALESDSGLPLTPEEMDEVWEEQFAFADELGASTGANGNTCPRSEEMLRRMEQAG